MGVNNITIHHNLYIHNSHRNPGVGSLRTQIINNVIYNWSPRAGSSWRNIDVDWIGNYFKPGPMSNRDMILVHVAFPADQPGQPWPVPSLYIAGNVAPPDFTDPEADNWAMYRLHYVNLPLPDEYRRHEPLPHPPVPVRLQTAQEAYEAVLSGAGASARLACGGGWVANGDAVDQRLIQDARHGTGPGGRPPAHENEVGGFPAIDPGTACPDRDRDGMPDAWELSAAVLDPEVDDSAGFDLDPKYTNLELYLNGMEFAAQPIGAGQ
jgi:hypothetical protein